MNPEPVCGVRYLGKDRDLRGAECVEARGHDGAHWSAQNRAWDPCGSVGGILGAPVRCLLHYGHPGAHQNRFMCWDRSPSDPEPS